MKEDNYSDIPEEIRPYLDEIAERLWSDHAVVMVGAGFSKNARKATSTSPSFPSWNELGDILYHKIHGSVPTPTTHYLNPLRLAQEVQAALGRPVLDQIIRTNIPDTQYEPSRLHVDLMELPWVDVLTTNYDTLLERACVAVESRRFDVVVNKEDLVNSTRPRIIKLHGSFPSERPFVITEEDYRRYPSDNAPFVNTVQQALLENTLCMIGFSGDDPNFIEWIGWIRDNLGYDNSPRIYLVGLLSISSAEERLLEQRKITVVNLRHGPIVAGSHEKALGQFLNYLASKRCDVVQLDWPRTTIDWSKADVQHITAALQKQRSEYAGWVVLPADRREAVWSELHALRPDRFLDDAVDAPDDLNFLYELNWLLERALCPILGAYITEYERILRRYDPFPRPGRDAVPEFTPDMPDCAHLFQGDLGSKWIDLNLALLRFLREESFTDKWVTLNGQIGEAAAHLAPEQLARWHYERCLQSLFVFDLNLLKRELAEWPTNESLPSWEAKRAGLIAEFGEIGDAERILEKALSRIRKEQNLSPVISDLSWMSQEGHTMMLLQIVKQSDCFTSGRFSDLSAIRQQYRERWDELRRYKCDPWDDFQLFELKLAATAQEYRTEVRTKGFDIGTEHVTRFLARGDTESLTGFAFLRYCEEVSVPFAVQGLAIAQTEADGAVKRMVRYSPYWALVTLLRSGDQKIVDSIYARDALARFAVEHIDASVSQIIGVAKRCEPFAAAQGGWTGNLGARAARVVPEILSRLCTKCSQTTLEGVIAFVKDCYLSERSFKYDGMDHLVARMLYSISEEHLYKLIPELLQIPIEPKGFFLTPREYPEPFRFVRYEVGSRPSKCPDHIDPATIAELISEVRAGNTVARERACWRLHSLFRLGVLDTGQVNQFVESMWEKLGDDGFPAHTGFYRSTFLRTPHPAHADPVRLFKQFVEETPILIDSRDGNRGISITRGSLPVLEEIRRATKHAVWGGVIDWTAQEAVCFLGRLVKWWDADKHFLKRHDADGGLVSYHDEFSARFRHLVIMLADVIAPRMTAAIGAETVSSVKRLLDEMGDLAVPSLQARAAFLHLLPEDQSGIYSEIGHSIVSMDENRIADGLRALLAILCISKSSETHPSVSDLLDCVGQQIKWRRDPGLRRSLIVASEIVYGLPQWITENMMSGVLDGLAWLRVETDVTTSGQESEVADKLEIRKHAAGLAYRLFIHFQGTGTEVPKSIADWRDVCASANEFAEIRNQWTTS